MSTNYYQMHLLPVTAPDRLSMKYNTLFDYLLKNLSTRTTYFFKLLVISIIFYSWTIPLLTACFNQSKPK